MKKGTLYLLPTYLHPDNSENDVAGLVGDVIKRLNLFLVENARTARRYISSLNVGISIESLRLETFDKHTELASVIPLLRLLKEGKDVGVLSEAGLPGVADPGAKLVAWAHNHAIDVVPITGASALSLTLTGTGFNGQAFTFHGYLPIDKRDRQQRIQQLVREVGKTGYTQLFMEVPHRNNQLMQALVETMPDNTWLAMGVNLGSNAGYVKTRSVAAWKLELPDLHKQLAVFAIGRLLLQ